MSTEHVEPCPFCGAEGSLVALVETEAGSFARCGFCQATGPFVPSTPRTRTAPVRAARLKWNFHRAHTAVDRIGAGADAAKRDCERRDLVILAQALVAQLEGVLRPAALPPKRVAGVWWPRDEVTAEEAARYWLAARGYLT